jgi:hypothetical protein
VVFHGAAPELTNLCVLPGLQLRGYLRIIESEGGAAAPIRVFTDMHEVLDVSKLIHCKVVVVLTGGNIPGRKET